jgi:adenosylcobinamide-GDP ribazoletransferase
MLKRELHIFLTAVMFYTRIPCPRWITHKADDLNQATRYFPLIGWIAGIVSWGFFMVGQYFFSPEVAVLLSMGGNILLTGAFHEDGFADVCDGFGGGWSKEKILVIMKDSRLGTYGVIGLLLLMLMKFYTLIDLSTMNAYKFGLVLVVAHALSRLAAVTVIFTSHYARDDADSKAKPVAQQLSICNLLLATLCGMLPLILFCYFDIQVLILILPVIGLTFLLRRYFIKWIGGYTGDCLGAIQQVTEVVVYLTVASVCKFI